ncbi:YfbK domain-containing protein [Sediminibacterium sp.]|uniref:vWA domain-containing protein n=1 Tax=Sediminibacterium sp. TaxID=1917865 RepID=UPI003F701A77
MNRLLLIVLFFVYFSPISAQYYLRGEINDNRGKKLEGVTILLQSRGSIPFLSGKDGDFGIPLSKLSDSISLSFPGYEMKKIAVNAAVFQRITLTMLPNTARLYQKNLSSVITNLKPTETSHVNGMGESYSGIVENGFIKAAMYPETGFSLNIDKAAYSNIRRFLKNEMRVPADAVRAEEMLNYFSFLSNNNAHTSQFNLTSIVTNCPWNIQNQLLLVNLAAPKINLDQIPPSNLVFLIDVSGSMDHPNRLPLLQSAFKLLTSNLRSIDTVSIVTYGGNVAIALYPTSGAEKKTINEVIDSLSANGDTPGENAIKVAYQLAKGSFIKGGNNRIILATDGDFNVGQRTEKELEDMITNYRESGIFLTCLGVGMGNYKDSKLEILSKKGNGNFAYLDQVAEAEKVLVKEFTSTLFAVAKDAILNVQFNKEVVSSYRLMGFDNKKDAIADSSAILNGGEIGSGHHSLALFEIAPENTNSAGTIASVSLEYFPMNENTKKVDHFKLSNEFIPIHSLDSSYRKMIAVAAFAGTLRKSEYMNGYQYDQVYELAASACNLNNKLDIELLQLIQKANKIYNPINKKKPRKNQ